MTTLFCRACGYSFDSVGGLLPDICAGCQREALWSTEPAEPLQGRWRFSETDLRDLQRIERFRAGPVTPDAPSGAELRPQPDQS